PARPEPSEEEARDLLRRFATEIDFQPRSPILYSPGDQGLAYEDVTFPSADGVPLEGWFIPAPGSNKLVIANHPIGFNRSGMPAHLEPWRWQWESSGNALEINFIPDYRIPHEAGFNVLAYDLRSHGHSGEGNGGVTSGGIYEARDVIGSLKYARDRRDTRDMAVGLFSRCLGAIATFAAMARAPEAFGAVRCLVAAQPVTARTILARTLARMGLPGRIDELERLIVMDTSIEPRRRDPGSGRGSVRVPTFLYQVRDDILTHPDDVRA
ncbi:alpha/beta hydrolase, partial [Spongiactinospora gelatinilytica]